MEALAGQGPWWAVVTVWGVVNAVNLLQSAGFLSRVSTGSTALNHRLGYVMIALAAPAALALVAFVRARAGLAAVDRPCRVPSLHRTDDRR